MATDLLKSRAFVRSELALEGYTWDVMGSLLEFAGAEAGAGSPGLLIEIGENGQVQICTEAPSFDI